MLLVKTKIGPSKIHGIGLFADEFIQKGKIIWKFAKRFDLMIEEKTISELSEPGKNFFLKYAYMDPGCKKYILDFDNSRFMNHSKNPNTISIYPAEEKIGITIASRNIKPSEEITGNYHEFDLTSNEKGIL